MAVTHYEAFNVDDEDYIEIALCGTRVGEKFEYSNNWIYVSCKKCLKKRKQIDSEVEAINKHRSEQDGATILLRIENVQKLASLIKKYYSQAQVALK